MITWLYKAKRYVKSLMKFNKSGNKFNQSGVRFGGEMPATVWTYKNKS